MSDQVLLRVPAIEIRQGRNRTLYSFAVDGKMLPEFTTVSRIRRAEEGDIFGYQRPEVLSHIAEIRRYIESNDPMIPNALVVAFDRRVQFKPFEDSEFNTGYSRAGLLVIPVRKDAPEEDMPGWIVDGQQRAAAIREAAVKSFPICMVGFIANNDQEQREQFILVNSTKPLPKSLIYELLPETHAALPALLQRRRFPAELLARLNRDADSPLRFMIETATNPFGAPPQGIIKDNSILKMLENSLSDGLLYRFRVSGTDDDPEIMLPIIKRFWTAISEVFKDIWGLPPRRSRLTHGAGVVSLGFLMDAIGDRYRKGTIPTVEQFQENLEPLRPICRWTEGYWEFGPGLQRKWNEVQNTPKDIQLLANYLLVQYRELVWNRYAKAASSTSLV
ncbi:MAG: DGQHR domain-containing protein DpdB [Planctomycetota bacterium]|nr:DGQHR domain-containing protein DpdB [Planctomycetota bacterium]